MKKLLTFLILTLGFQVAHASDRPVLYTRDNCPQSSTVMAQLMVDYASRGIYDNSGRAECAADLSMQIFPSAESFKDEEITKQNKIVLTPADKISIINVTESKDSEGIGTNEFVVVYKIEQSGSAKAIEGNFTFNRYYDEGLKMVGCAFFHRFPTEPFIRKECLKKP